MIYSGAHDVILADKSTWRWTLLIMQPDRVAEERFERALSATAEKKDLAALPGVRFERSREGRAAQV